MQAVLGHNASLIGVTPPPFPLALPPVPKQRDKALVPEPYDAGHPISVLIILPDRDFDVTEVSVPWFLLRRRGHDVVFATEHGTVAQCDPLLLTGTMVHPPTCVVATASMAPCPAPSLIGVSCPGLLGV